MQEQFTRYKKSLISTNMNTILSNRVTVVYTFIRNKTDQLWNEKEDLPKCKLYPVLAGPCPMAPIQSRSSPAWATGRQISPTAQCVMVISFKFLTLIRAFYCTVGAESISLFFRKLKIFENCLKKSKVLRQKTFCFWLWGYMKD